MSKGPSIEAGYAYWGLRTPWFSARIPIRVMIASSGLFLLAVLAVYISLFIGDYPLTMGDVKDALTGNADDYVTTIVVEWRLPAAVAAIVFGFVLAIGGAIFQTLTRNPLASPDLIGFDAGSYTAVVISIIVLGSTNYWDLAVASIAGGLITAAVVYILSYRGGIQGFRLIIVGIGISGMLTSVTTYLMTRADLDDAVSVGFWAAGSISEITWKTLNGSLVVSAVITLAAGSLWPALRILELGDDAATTLGLNTTVDKLALMATAVTTGALVTAAVGPIGFVALVAPQVGRRLANTTDISLAVSGATGAALLGMAHLSSKIFGSFYAPVPVGLVTVCIGGTYLVWMLIRESRMQGGQG